MKIGFSTLSCLGWTFKDTLITAKNLGFDGIELRAVNKESYVPKTKPFSEENIEGTKAKFEDLGLEVSILTSNAYLYDKDNIEKVMQEVEDFSSLAGRLGVKYVRVLGDKRPQPGDNVDVLFVAEALKAAAQIAGKYGVTILIETNGVFANSKLLRDTIESTCEENIGVLWDINHPYRFMDESIEQTYENIGKYVKHVHVKDSVKNGDKIEFKVLGYGDLPVKEALDLLKANSYPGYVSLEWAMNWTLDYEEPGVLLSHFRSTIGDMI